MPKSTQSKLKIGFVIDDGLDKPDGVQQYVLTLGAWLKKQGHLVRYLAGETNRADLKEIIPLSKNLRVRFNGNTLSTPLPASSAKLKDILAKENFDILHVQVPYSPFLAAKAVRLAGKGTRIIGTFHILPVGKLQSFGNRLLAMALRFNLRKFDEFVSVSEPAQKFAERVYGINSRVVPNPVETAKFQPDGKKRGDSPVDIVFLGRLVPRKGCEELLTSVSMLLERGDLLPLRLHICGDGPEKKKLESYIRNTNLKNITTMHGFVSEKDKVRFLNEADFAVFPSLFGESFGIVLIEAMAAKAGVVLAGNNPGYASVMADNPECLFDPRNPLDLTNKLDELIRNKEARTRLHKSQQQTVKAFDINTVGNTMLQIYQKS